MVGALPTLGKVVDTLKGEFEGYMKNQQVCACVCICVCVCVCVCVYVCMCVHMWVCMYLSFCWCVLLVCICGVFIRLMISQCAVLLS